jgi:ribosomal protein S18 acetylase RimI-like enzyme
VHIRPAGVGDREFVLELAGRLIEFGSVPGRDPSQMLVRDRAVLAGALEQSSADTSVFVAEDDAGEAIGFIHLTTTDDYYTNSSTAHIADVVVVTAFGGRGTGSALIAFAEQWARARGFDMLTLNVFSANRRARELYARLGFQEEWIRCVKRL